MSAFVWDSRSRRRRDSSAQAARHIMHSIKPHRGTLRSANPLRLIDTPCSHGLHLPHVGRYLTGAIQAESTPASPAMPCRCASPLRTPRALLWSRARG
jgi:hypothetical protein